MHEQSDEVLNQRRLIEKPPRWRERSRPIPTNKTTTAEAPDTYASLPLGSFFFRRFFSRAESVSPFVFHEKGKSNRERARSGNCFFYHFLIAISCKLIFDAVYYGLFFFIYKFFDRYSILTRNLINRDVLREIYSTYRKRSLLRSRFNCKILRFYYSLREKNARL